MKEATLHEFLHAMLISRADSANQLLDSIAKWLVVGPDTPKTRLDQIIHRYLLAQEESFVYASVGGVYSGFASNKAPYDDFITKAETLFVSRGITLRSVKHSLAVAEKVKGKGIPWSITFAVPVGPIVVTAADMSPINGAGLVFPGG